MSLSVVPLSPALGAEIPGVDLRQPLDQATVKAVNDAFDQNVAVVSAQSRRHHDRLDNDRAKGQHRPPSR
jgi:alpha-ketoglutarate-dependent taurine dioxygenase